MKKERTTYRSARTNSRIRRYLCALCFLCALCANGQQFDYELRAGYSVGGTLPMGFPAAVRGLNSYSPKFNYRVGADAVYRWNEHWGVQTGLYFEQKGFKSDVTLRQFDVILRQGVEEITGPYTGNVVINVRQTGFTLPIQAIWQPTPALKAKAGIYLSLLTGRSFYGYAYGETGPDGKSTAYLRRGEVRGDLVYVGNDETTRGYFSGDSFNGYMRRFQWGLDLGVDWTFAKKWGAFADLSYGLNSAFNDSEGNPVTMGLHPLYGTFGLVYKLKH